MVSVCTAAQYDEALKILDEEFIQARGRSISLAERYPDVYGREHRERFFVERAGEEIVAVAVIKPFACQGAATVRSGAMVGGVCTAPGHRGQGYATAVLRHIDRVLAAGGFDCAVLWTGHPEFYARRGWMPVAGELFGELRAVRPCDGGSRVTRSGPVAEHATEIEEMRRLAGGGWQRAVESYKRRPLPVTHTFCAIARGAAGTALAVAGERENQAIVYEMYGDEAGLQAILADLRRNFERVWLNDFAGSATQARCARVADVAWQERPARLCRTYGRHLTAEDVQGLRIPAWDRI